MNFTFKIDSINFKAEIFKDENYDVELNADSIARTDLKELRQGKLAVYQLFITSSKDQQTMKHYASSVIMSAKQEDILEDLHTLLDNSDMIPKILKHWELEES